MQVMHKHSPLVLEYLKTHTLMQLETEHGVCARPNARLDKVSLNYDQTMIRSGDVLAEQCRGMVIRPRDWLTVQPSAGPSPKDGPWRHQVLSGGVELLAWPMSRFYNDGDPAAASIDWAHARVLEKLDGTMCVPYWDPHHDRWHVATRSVPEADLPVKAGHLVIGDMTFADLFWRSLSATIARARSRIASNEHVGPAFLECLQRRVTYTFELTGPHNKVVVDYPDERVTLLAARDLDTGRELDPRTLGGPFGPWVPLAREWDLMDPNALRQHVKTYAGNVCEGAVVVSWGEDPEPARSKFKNDRWRMAARFKDTIDSSRRGALRMIADGTWTPTSAEISAEVQAQFMRLHQGLVAYLTRVDANFRTWHDAAMVSDDPNMRKTFALLVQTAKPADQSPAYFPLWEGKVDSAMNWLTSLAKADKLTDGTIDAILDKIDRFHHGEVSKVF